MLLFGLMPALRASAVKPASALRGGEDPHTRRRTMHALIAAQVAFCFLILFVAGLFAATFERLSHRPTGFSADRLLLLHTVAQREEAPVFWDQVAEHLRTVPGVEAVALAGWPLLDGNAWNGFISVNGAPPGPDLAYFLAVSPGWVAPATSSGYAAAKATKTAKLCCLPGFWNCCGPIGAGNARLSGCFPAASPTSPSP
jgi:hypothetical protein